MLDFGRRMNEAGVLGVNRRNTEFIMKLNPRRLYPRVDDKVLTKKLALEAGIAVPELYGLISSQSEIRNLPQIVENRASFVIKPARGSGGDGILVIAGQSHRRHGLSPGKAIEGTAATV
jgi:glutathione synthase/RimK-type ligase-like ATP-grasp enzyme